MNTIRPTVSIIIPCYNASGLVGDAIRSALAQTYQQIEVIVIDDGSADDSLQVIRAFGKQIRWQTGPNRGACAARNQGVALATGKLIQFLDSDDLLHHDKLECQVPVMLQRNVDAVGCDIRIVDAETGDELERHKPRTADTFSRCCFDNLTTPGPLHWKSNLERVGGFRDELPCAQERDLHMRMASHGITFGHVAQTLVTVRRQQQSLSSDLFRVLNQHLGIAFECVRILDSRNDDFAQNRRILAGFLARDARFYLREGLHEQAVEYFAAARRIHPDGGLRHAYSPPTRWLRCLLGARVTEQLTTWKRKSTSSDHDPMVSDSLSPSVQNR